MQLDSNIRITYTIKIENCDMISTDMDTYDITGLDPASAKQIVVQVITSLKKTKEQRAEVERDLELWRNRVRLASEKGRSDLEAEAQTRVGDLQLKLDSLKAEEHDLESGVARMKRQLKDIENRPQMSVDTDRLLAEMELLGGETDELEETFKQEEVNDLLDRLKKDMSDESGTDT